ncbi:LPS assembly protein LptD [Deltaproteobacteria bacterium IMCC39524]|nr:LPS assembly protein LptD [Deltaproteobacteria bacterium IMCC39524]
MQRLSLRASFCVLLLAALLLPVPVVNKAFAQPGITVGFAVDGSGLVISSELGKEVGLYLKERLLTPVDVRSFTSEDFLYNWLVRYREVDFAWLSKAYLGRVPEGAVFPLTENLDHFPGLFKGSIVARQGQQTALLQQVSNVFLSMHESPEGRALLQKLEISRFISSSHWQTPEWVGAEQVPSEPTPSPLERDSLKISVQGETPSSKITSEPFAEDELKVEDKTPEIIGSSGSKRESTSLDDEEPLVDEALSKISEGRPTPVIAAMPDSSVAEIADVSPQVKDDSQDEPVFETPSDSVDSSFPLSVDDNDETEIATEPALKADQESPIALVADSLTYDSDEDSYEAKGDVVLRQGELELKSDTLLWQAATQDASAEGAVELKDIETKLLGSSLQYNMTTRQGQVRDGRLFVSEGNFHLSGQQIEKEGQFEYSVKEGSFTTCDGEIPDWKFSADEVDITVGGYARAQHVWFHVKDVPVLYTPYMAFPVKTERQSGLLTPSFGYSNNKGTLASLAWYQVIDRHMDATIYLDYLSEVGLGKGLEYRYALPGQNNGKALYYHVTGTGEIEELDQKEDFPDLDYYRWKHSGRLPGGWRLMADIEYTDQKLFFEEFGEVAEDYNRDKTVSTLMLRRNWQKLNVVGFARYTKDLETDNDETLQTLPELSFGLPRYRLGDTAFYAGLESYATRFWRDEGERGERLYLRPSLSAVFKPGSWLEVTPEAAFYERLYSTDVTETDKFIPEVSLALSSRLVKSFDVNLLGSDRIQHSIEPTVTYTYVPDEEQGSLPLFDLRDRVLSRNDVTYALVNRLTARSQAADGSSLYRDLFYLRLSQRYDIDEVRNDRSGEKRPFSDLRVEMDFTPVNNFSFNAESIIPVYGDSGFNTLSAGSTLKDDTGNAVSASYTYKDADFAGVATDYVSFQVDTSILQPLYVRFKERYDFQENRALEDFVGLEYRSKCWSIILSYKTRYLEDEDNDHEIGFTFVLAGLGPPMGFAEGVDKDIE